MADLPNTADFVIIGGGVHGASLAFHLARKKAGRVLLFEKKFIASGPTGRSTALVRRFYAMDFFTRTASAAAEMFRQMGGYSGLYDATPDHHPVLGAIAPYAGLFADFGWSGHGFKHSPLIGDIISDVILHGRSKDYDITPFRWTRFTENDLVPSARWAAPPHPEHRL